MRGGLRGWHPTWAAGWGGRLRTLVGVDKGFNRDLVPPGDVPKAVALANRDVEVVGIAAAIGRQRLNPEHHRTKTMT